MLIRGVIIDPATIEQLAWTLVYSLWQQLGIAVVLALALTLLRKRSPEARYRASFLALLACGVAPIVTFAVISGRFDDPGPLLLQWGAGQRAVSPSIQPWTARAITLMQPALAWIVGIYLLGLVFFCAKTLLGWILLQRLLRRQCQPLHPDRRGLEELVSTCGVRRRVTFLETRIDSPATTGWIHPVILLPVAGTNAPSHEQLSLAVSHELAHIRRHDYVAGIIQAGILSIFFYHPAVRWISRQIDIERENCCDDSVDRMTGKRTEYAWALYSFASAGRSLAPALSLSGADGTLLNRVTRLTVEPHLRHRHPPALAPLFAAATIGLICCQLALRASFVRPERDVTAARSLSGYVYDILEVPRGGGDFLAAMDKVVAAYHGGHVDRESIDTLVNQTLQDPRCDALSDAMLANMTAANPHAFSSSSGWSHGAPIEHINVVRLLQDQVHTELNDAVKSRKARATILISAQESGLAGAGLLGQVLHNEEIVQAAGLNGRQLSRMQRHIEDHLTISRAVGQLRANAEEALAGAKNGSIPPSAVDDLEHLAELAPLRVDVQWALANLFSQAEALGGRTSPAVIDLKAQIETKISDPAFLRLMNTPSAGRPVRTIKRMSSAEFLAARRG